jgi:superfamily II DNA or RNA helicase
MRLRSYQTNLINLIRDEIASGKKKVIGWLATGGGKSPVTMKIIKNMVKNGKKVVFVVRRRQLVIETQRKFSKNMIPCSVIMGKERGFNPNLPVQICSIDTVRKEKDEYKFIYDFDSVVVDECHDTTSPTYRNFFSRFSDKTLFIGFTATPFLNGGKAQDFWESCVKSIEVENLIELGYLVEPKIYCPVNYDFSHISVTAGDYNQKQISKEMQRSHIVGDVVENYKKFGENKAAICFAVDKTHSKLLCEAFNDAGIPAVHCDESSKQIERDDALEGINSGRYRILCNCNIFSTGMDLPKISVGILARPTKSQTLYIQQAGRVLRPYRICGNCKTQYDNSEKCPSCNANNPSEIKKYAIIIDHGNNTYEHGTVDMRRKAVLQKPEKQKKSAYAIEEIKVKACENCKYVYASNVSYCPACEHENQKVVRTIKTVDGELAPYDQFVHIESEIKTLKEKGIVWGWKPNAHLFKCYEKFGDSVYKFEELKFPKWIKVVSEKGKK